MDAENDQTVREEVRKRYGEIARDGGSCCGGGACCVAAPDASRALGYSDADLAAVPDGANLGLDCGNPQAIAALVPGERVLDLGSGGGFDCFLAARQVGPTGHVIGVDMTPDMVERARTLQVLEPLRGRHCGSRRSPGADVASDPPRRASATGPAASRR